MKRFGGHHGTQKAPKMDPQIVFLATQMEQKFGEFGAFFGKRVQMPLGDLQTPILEPRWSQFGSNWGWERLQHGSKSESVPPIVCTAIGGTPAAASNRQQQTSEDPSWNPDGSNGDLLSFCFQMFSSASRSLAVKGLCWNAYEGF